MKLIDTGRSSNGFSTIGSMLYCPRKHAFDLESRAAGADGQRHASATDRGTLVHVALAHHYITKVAGENPADWYPWRDALLQTREGKQFEEEEPQFMVYLRNLMGSYFTFYEDVDRDDWEILHVEREYRARIGGHPIGRRIDLVARHRGTGKIWFWDHKTSSGTLNDLEMRYLLSGDMLLSRLLGKAQYGEEFGGILINKIRVYQKIVNPQFDRVELPPVAEATLQSFRDSLIRAYEQRELLKLRPDGTPRPAVEWPGAHNELVCLTRYGLCPYFFRCQDGD